MELSISGPSIIPLPWAPLESQYSDIETAWDRDTWRRQMRHESCWRYPSSLCTSAFAISCRAGPASPPWDRSFARETVQRSFCLRSCTQRYYLLSQWSLTPSYTSKPVITEHEEGTAWNIKILNNFTLKQKMISCIL